MTVRAEQETSLKRADGLIVVLSYLPEFSLHPELGKVCYYVDLYHLLARA